MIQGVQIDMISADRLSKMASQEKIRMILDDVHQGCVVVLEHGLSPDEQASLLERTMMEITPGAFSGIEIETYPSNSKDKSFISKLFGKNDIETRMMVIGPVDQFKIFSREKDRLIAWASAPK